MKYSEAVFQVNDEIKRLIIRLDTAEENKDGTHYRPKDTGAVRRASMDLSRALVELRKAWH